MSDSSVLIWDDHPAFATGMAGVLRECIVTTSNCKKEACLLLRDHAYDCVIVGCNSLRGLAVARTAVRSLHRTVIISQYYEPFFDYLAEFVGCELLSKSITPEEFKASIIEGASPRGGLAKGVAEAGGVSEVLSERERQVFELYAQGMAANGIAAKYALAPKSVEEYLRRIRSKLGLDARSLRRFALCCQLIWGNR